MNSASSYQVEAQIKEYASNPFTPLPSLKGISPGVEKPKVEKATLEKLLEVYERVKEECRDVVAVEDKLKLLLSKIDYCEKDISNLVAAAQILDENESMAFGAYVGSLITILTERNEAKGKRTIIEISENRLDYLGYDCRKFDVVRFGANNGDCVFSFAKNGNELYVEDCEGSSFAHNAGLYGAHVGEIKANIVDGDGFAEDAGSNDGHVDKISAGTVNGERFASFAGWRGHVGEISAGTVNGEKFAFDAGWTCGHVGKISADVVNGEKFAYFAGSSGGRVGKISAGTVNGGRFAEGAGVDRGHVGEISADVVNGELFAEDASAKKIYVRKISEEARETMNPKTIIGDWEVEK